MRGEIAWLLYFLLQHLPVRLISVTFKQELQIGPVLSRFDRFLLIVPRATTINQRKLHFLSKLHVYRASAGPIVFQGVLRDQNGSKFFSFGLSKDNVNSLYYHHQNTLKPCFTLQQGLKVKFLPGSNEDV